MAEPVPAAPAVTVRNADSLTAVHAQVNAVVTAASPVPAIHSTSRRSGVTVYSHGSSTGARALRAASPPSTAAATWYR